MALPAKRNNNKELSIDPKKVLEDIQVNGRRDLSGLVPLFKKGSKRLSLQDRKPFTPLFTLDMPKTQVWMCGRQVSKSFSLGMIATMLGGMVADFPILIVEPRFDQLKRFEAQILSPLMKGFELSRYLIDSKCADSMTMKTFRNANELMMCATYKSPDNSRGASGVALLAVDECQDINPDFIPVLQATMDANELYGATIFTGSAKSKNDTLGDEFEQSSQGHWGVRCACGKWSIAALEEQLIKMIGKEGCTCHHCSRILNVRSGSFIMKNPDLKHFRAGFHVPQIVLPFHCENPSKWMTLLERQRKWPMQQFYNEVLGVPLDSSMQLLTLQELLKARNAFDNTLKKALAFANNYELITVAVDWSGGGGGMSRTAIAIAGRQYGVSFTDVIYMETLQQGLTPEAEASRVIELIDMFNAEFWASDFTGAGYLRATIMLMQRPDLNYKHFPVTLGYRPSGELVKYVNNGDRRSFIVDKTKSILLTISCIRSGDLTVPWFDPKEESSPQLELLNIVEKKQELESTKEIYLLERVTKKFDDAAQAVNIAQVCLCDRTGVYPSIYLDSKYDMSEQDVYDVTGEFA